MQSVPIYPPLCSLVQVPFLHLHSYLAYLPSIRPSILPPSIHSHLKNQESLKEWPSQSSSEGTSEMGSWLPSPVTCSLCNSGQDAPCHCLTQLCLRRNKALLTYDLPWKVATWWSRGRRKEPRSPLASRRFSTYHVKGGEGGRGESSQRWHCWVTPVPHGQVEGDTVSFHKHYLTCFAGDKMFAKLCHRSRAGGGLPRDHPWESGYLLELTMGASSLVCPKYRNQQVELAVFSVNRGKCSQR